MEAIQSGADGLRQAVKPQAACGQIKGFSGRMSFGLFSTPKCSINESELKLEGGVSKKQSLLPSRQECNLIFLVEALLSKSWSIQVQSPVS